jgi:hypothetical protein
MGKERHSWKFFRAGGVDQVVLSTAEDLANLATLDQKLWVALACPAKGLEFDERTMELLDSDHNGRIRPPEILAAVEWLKDSLKDLGELYELSDALPLASIATGTPTGEQLLAGAKLVLESLGKADSSVMTLADVSSTEAVFIATKLNGDGVVPPDSADDDETRKIIEDVISVVGSVTDRSKKPGVDQAKVDAFFDQASLYADWLEAGRSSSVRVVGESSTAAAGALEAVRAKIDDYFARCRLAALDPRAAGALGVSEAALAELAPHLLGAGSEEVAKLPIARIESSRPLPLGDDANLAWSTRLQAFAKTTVPAVLGGTRATLSEHDWNTIKERMAPFAAWQATRPVTDVAMLGDERVLSLSRGPARKTLTELIAKDAALAAQADQIESLEKLVRFRRHLVTLLRNFVSFAAFYGGSKAIFQAGTLYLDARSCNLCLSVEDPGRHALLAGSSQAFLVYCDCVRKADQAKRTIVAAVTGGDVDNILVGRNGVFYDRNGADWDATVTQIVENPISVRQAFWLPYKRFIRLVEQSFAKRTKAAGDESGKKIDTMAIQTGSLGAGVPDADKAKAAKEEKKAVEPKPIDVGTVAAIGVAVGGIATFFSSILATFLGLGMWMPIGVVVLLLAIAGPSMLIAWLKLRQRNIGPILDANGWAVNTLARVNVPFGGALTDLATLPPGASRSLRDPFAEKRTPWRLYGLLLVLLGIGVLWVLGRLDPYLPEKVRATTVMHRPPTVETPSPAKSEH